MDKKSFKHIVYDTDLSKKYSFRGLLSQKYNFENINFSKGGSSNQWQFRLARDFFGSSLQMLLDSYSPIIVLHGITSTSRNEMFSIKRNKLTNFMYGDHEYADMSRPMLDHFYDHDNEVAQLAQTMLFMNAFYKSVGIVNLWFDTFNHHEYNIPIDNLIGEKKYNRDLMSELALENGLLNVDNRYHLSEWKQDSNRVKFLVDKELLNPYSHHPTRLGHELIANFIDKEIIAQCYQQGIELK